MFLHRKYAILGLFSAACMLSTSTSAATVEELEERLNQTAIALDELMQERQSSAVTVGGYGELHYNKVKDAPDELDFHRFVLFIGKQISDDIRFQSEFELEHAIAGEGQPGEVELEQAFIEMDLNERHKIRGGVFLIPVGILNQTHEPPTFYGVERNPVEKNIIPSTWWEGGAGMSGELTSSVRYDVSVTSGLMVDSADYKIRGGRQKVAEAVADDFAYTAAFNWTAMAGANLGVTFQHQSDLTQGADVSAQLIETHAVVQKGDFGLRALYATWMLDGDAPKALGRDEQTGWYIEPSYKVTSQIGVFARYNEWDNEAGDSADSVNKQTDVGVNYWPHPDVVVKADYQDQSGAADKDAFNLGVGYQF